MNNRSFKEELEAYIIMQERETQVLSAVYSGTQETSDSNE